MLGYSRETTYSNLGYLSSLSLFGLLENHRLGWYGWADQISPAEATERLVDQDKPGRRSPIQRQPFKSASPSSGYSSNQPAQPISQSKSVNRTAPGWFGRDGRCMYSTTQLRRSWVPPRPALPFFCWRFFHFYQLPCH